MALSLMIDDTACDRVVAGFEAFIKNRRPLLA
jgi:hypothetical protein